MFATMEFAHPKNHWTPKKEGFESVWRRARLDLQSPPVTWDPGWFLGQTNMAYENPLVSLNEASNKNPYFVSGGTWPAGGGAPVDQPWNFCPINCPLTKHRRLTPWSEVARSSGWDMNWSRSTAITIPGKQTKWQWKIHENSNHLSRCIMYYLLLLSCSFQRGGADHKTMGMSWRWHACFTRYLFSSRVNLWRQRIIEKPARKVSKR